MSILTQFKQWISSIVMWRYLKVILHNKQNLLKLLKEKKAKAYLLWSIRSAKTVNGLVKKDYPFCTCTSAELGLELGMSVNNALDLHNDINLIVNANKYQHKLNLKY